MQSKKNILKYSNPDKVFEKAKKYLGNDTRIQLSTKKNKKYMVYNPHKNKWIHFGMIPYQDFTKSNNRQQRKRYLIRSASIPGNWKKDKYSPNNLSRHILW